jgi:hypothetical protein
MEYSLKEVVSNIFSVTTPDNYDLCMLFCRAQEFYESPNRKVRNCKFSIWDYYKWYSKTYSGCFSYVKDWSGFNLPIEIAIQCYKLNKIETPYDDLFIKIIKQTKSKNGYIIGVNKIGNSTYYHELCHGLYYTNKNYKKDMNSITNNLSKSNLKKMTKNLLDLGYCSKVVKDEIQAYMATEDNPKISKGIASKKSIHKYYKEVFLRFN